MEQPRPRRYPRVASPPPTPTTSTKATSPRPSLDFAAETGGVITAADLAAHTSTWVDPIPTSYRGYDVWEIPPNGQGIAALIALNILEGFDLARLAA